MSREVLEGVGVGAGFSSLDKGLSTDSISWKFIGFSGAGLTSSDFVSMFSGSGSGSGSGFSSFEVGFVGVVGVVEALTSTVIFAVSEFPLASVNVKVAV